MSTDHDEEKSTLPAPRAAEGQAVRVEAGAEAQPAEGGARAELTGPLPPDIRHAIERFILSQEALAESIDKANPDDRYASLMVREDVELVREWLASEERPAVPDARITDLAKRLVASGPKAAHVSASECHEISDFILSCAATSQPPADHPDTARLDWLERHPRLAEFVVDGQVTDCYLYAVSGAPGLKLREIIDAAMRAEPSKPAGAEVRRG